MKSWYRFDDTQLTKHPKRCIASGSELAYVCIFERKSGVSDPTFVSQGLQTGPKTANGPSDFTFGNVSAHFGGAQNQPWNIRETFGMNPNPIGGTNPPPNPNSGGNPGSWNPRDTFGTPGYYNNQGSNIGNGTQGSGFKTQFGFIPPAQSNFNNGFNSFANLNSGNPGNSNGSEAYGFKPSAPGGGNSGFGRY